LNDILAADNNTHRIRQYGTTKDITSPVWKYGQRLRILNNR